MIDTGLADEYLEVLWILREKGQQKQADVKAYFGNTYSQDMLDYLLEEGYITVSAPEGLLAFTDKGESKSRSLIRAHRLAERLLHDVLGIDNYELAACEFEHIVATDLVDGICTLLGHPRRCPDGLAIPPGACCEAESRMIKSPAVSLQELLPGQSGRVISVNAEKDQQLHILEILQIRPGMVVRIHQTAPTVVLECEGAIIAIDDEIAASIFVWRLHPTDVERVLERRGHHRGCACSGEAHMSENRRRRARWLLGRKKRYTMGESASQAYTDSVGNTGAGNYSKKSDEYQCGPAVEGVHRSGWFRSHRKHGDGSQGMQKLNK